jgi:UV DNA damage endonuclease
MRISSELFPFASHDQYGYDLDYAAAELKVRTHPYLPRPRYRIDSDLAQTAGDLANQYGHRMTLHPGQVGHQSRSFLGIINSRRPPYQFTQIGSPKRNVVEASIRELHCTHPDGPYLMILSTTESLV